MTMKTVPQRDHLGTTNPAWRGALKINYRHHQGRTEVSQAYAKAPLRIQRPFYPESSGVCQSVILHTAGGMVGGDQLRLDLELGEQAQVLVTTAAASKIYRTAGPPVEQRIQIHIAANACLEWLPQETIVFNQARYHQTMRVELAPGGLWLAWEITRFGRTARAESFEQGQWQAHTEVWQGNMPLWIDRQWLPGSPAQVASLHGLNHCPLVGSFVLIGREVDPKLIQRARELWPGPMTEIGVSRLAAGMICRYRGTDRIAVRAWFIAVWQLLRVSFLDRAVSIPRVWGV